MKSDPMVLSLAKQLRAAWTVLLDMGADRSVAFGVLSELIAQAPDVLERRRRSR